MWIMSTTNSQLNKKYDLHHADSPLCTLAPPGHYIGANLLGKLSRNAVVVTADCVSYGSEKRVSFRVFNVDHLGDASFTDLYRWFRWVQPKFFNFQKHTLLSNLTSVMLVVKQIRINVSMLLKLKHKDLLKPTKIQDKILPTRSNIFIALVSVCQLKAFLQ